MLSWSSSSHYYQAGFNSPGLSAASYPYCAIRIGQSTESNNPSGADQNLRIIIQDTNGGSAFFTASAFSRLLYPDTGGVVSKTMMQTLRIPLSVIRDRGVNVGKISLIKLAFDQVSTGKVYFDELQVSN